MGCIPPIPDFNTGAPTCPEGYFYDPNQKLCCPLSTAPVDLNDPTIRKLVVGLGDTEKDFAQAAKVGMQGVKASGWIERFIVAALELPLILLGPLITFAVSLFDDLLTVLAKAFLASQGEQGSGYYRLAAALMQDMLNIEVSEEGLVSSFQHGGRVEAMRSLGGKVVDTLAGEFLGIKQVAANGTFQAGPGSGIAGLPDVALSGPQGVAGLKAFVGFMTAFAIREGNTDMLSSLIPFGAGEIFKDFAEDFAKNLGIGRLGRIAWKPIVTTTIGVPVQWALNEQYRPTRFDVGQAYRAWAAGAFTSEELLNELRQHGWSEGRQTGLQWQHLKGPDRTTLRTLHAVGAIADPDYALWEGRDGRTAEVTALLDQHDDWLPARNASLLAAHGFATEYLRGKITTAQFHAALDSVAVNATGQRFLTTGEVANLQLLTSGAVAGTRTHVRLNLLFREYEDGLLTLGEFEQRVTELGYSPDDVQLLTQELLIAAKRASDRAAAATTRARRGRLAHLTVAQMKTAFEQGLLTLDEVKAELADRQYAPDAIVTIADEFLIAAKLRTTTPPKA
jgi:hypothetical protein